MDDFSEIDCDHCESTNELRQSYSPHKRLKLNMVKQLDPPTELVVDRRRVKRRNTTVKDAIHEKHEVVDQRKVERRRQIDPTTCERDYSEPEVDFMKAMDDYKRRSGRQFPTWSEVLEVIHSMGYRQVAEPTDISL